MRLSSPAKKIILTFFLFIVCLFISLPGKVPLKIHFQNINFEKEIIRPNLDLKIGNFEIKKNFDLVLGLDLAGGSHLVFEADTSQIGSDNKKDALESARHIIETREN